ncbi:lysoplasmalogenase [Rhodanobacter denitrificans]|uniref:Lysoplasmalogenase n=1 Tax=Rhodanobacter denitrificans TaxID=666685 RepID=A0A368KD51_9GAMM|nr:lysoplasmalogenase [Rhodanobacter denitrificans]RCS29834.1 lysoplasmalogenase [Rhodanobacter denitrificans]
MIGRVSSTEPCMVAMVFRSPLPAGVRRFAFATSGAAAVAIAGALLGAGDAGSGWLWLHWIGKPLATALIFMLAWRARSAPSPRYRRWMLAGIACSLAGDVLLMLPGDLFVPGLLAFLLAHACFIAAFLGDSRFAVPAWPLAACLAYGAANLALLWGAIDAPLRVPVVVYVAVLATMGGQAVARALASARRHDAQAPAARLAARGALVFMLSDSLLAWDRFRGPLPGAGLWVLAAYYLALWWIARSVQGTPVEDEAA